MDTSRQDAPGADPDLRDLAEAAQAWGIETQYWDIWGRQHHASERLQRAILRSLGVENSARDSLRHAVQGRFWREWLRPLPPTIVVGREACQIAVSVSGASANAEAQLDIRFEAGDTRQLRVDLGQLAVSEAALMRGRRFVRKLIPLPADLPLGYHELTIRIDGETWPPSRLILCPSRAYQPEWLESGQVAGIGISLYGLRSERNWGSGDVTDLEAVIDWAAEHTGASFIALNPLHAIQNRQPFNTSPYLPNSVFYRNAIYLDIERIVDFQSSPQACRLFASDIVRKEIDTLRSSEFVEYERVYRLKLFFLKLLFRVFLKEWAADTKRACELRAYIEQEGGLLHRFAVYSALEQAIRRRRRDVWTWRSWPEPCQDPDSAATQEFARKNSRAVLFHKYVQWQLDLQFAAAQEHALKRGLGIGLYHDLALATDRFGSDLWAHRDFFVHGCRVGAPPDAFSPKGQDWAFPPPNSDRHYQDGYRLFAESIRKNCRHGGALRIDHVMRLFRLFWIPDDMEAAEGTYVRDRSEDLLHILALESVRQKVLIVGEDLGTVPGEIRDSLRRFGILGYRLFYFEQEQDGRLRPPNEYPRDALVSITTHDLPTLAGFWQGRDIDARHSTGLLSDDSHRRMREERLAQKQKILDALADLKPLPDWFPRNASEVPELTGELHNAIVGFLASTPSKLMVLNQEDLLKETEQQNLPGTTAEYPNWRRKMKCTVEELQTSTEVQAFTRMFRSWLERTGRLRGSEPSPE